MSIGAGMNAGVSGLRSQATRLGAISDNIANSSTVGYKGARVQFSSLVTDQIGNTTYSAGGVISNVRTEISKQGLLQGTAASTDFSINGGGFMPVAQASDPSNIDPQQDKYMLTRAGSFRPDADGNLVNSAGLYLQGWRLNSDGTTEIANPSRDSFQDLETVNVTGLNFTGSATSLIEFAGNLPEQNTGVGGTGEDVQISLEYYDPVGNTEKVTLQFTPSTTTEGEWTLEIIDSATAAPGVIGEYTVTFNQTNPNAGKLNSIVPTTGTYDNTTGNLSVTTATGPLDINVGVPNGDDGLTQFAGSFSPTRVSKDGAKFGTVETVEINDKGIVEAVFDNGERRPIYQIPIANVVNPDGLQNSGGNAYSLSKDSGSFYLWDSEEGPVGTISGYSLEQSTVDIAEELTDMIQTQRAYSSNAKVIQTADEMLQETTQLKR